MVAGKARETTVIMFPNRELTMSTFYIVYWTDIGTDTTLHAALLLNMEWLIGNELIYKIRT